MIKIIPVRSEAVILSFQLGLEVEIVHERVGPVRRKGERSGDKTGFHFFTKELK